MLTISTQRCREMICGRFIRRNHCRLKLLLCVLVVLSIWFGCSRTGQQYYRYASSCYYTRDHWPITVRNYSGQECNCESTYHHGLDNFCYTANGLTGRRFSCHHISLLETLMPPTNKTVVEGFIDILIVTAASQDHFEEVYRLVDSLNVYFPQNAVMLYDFGLTGKQRMRLIATNRKVKVHQLDFGQYPSYVGADLKEYRWKFPVMALALQQASTVLWLDASVVFDDRAVQTQMDALIHCAGCASPIRLMLNPHHSVLAATHPLLYVYLPVAVRRLHSVPMLATGMVYLERGQLTNDLLKWLLLCSLEQHCMAPPHSVIQCHWDKRDNQYVSDFSCCHRFDQSALNVLLATHFNFDINKYFYSSPVSFKIRRDFFNY